MGIYIFKKVLSPEFIFELHQEIPDGIKMGEVTIIQEKALLAAVLVEATSLKKAKQQANALVEDRLGGMKHGK